MAKPGIVKKGALQDRDTRPIRWRKYPHLFLIVCEDQNTEPYYFDSFKKLIPPETIFLKSVGTGKGSLGVVEQAEEEKKRLADESGKHVDEVWAVFDKDDADKYPGNRKRFTDAFNKAKEYSIKVAYSNEAFELWLLLHLSEVGGDEPIGRSDLNGMIEERIKRHPGYPDFIYKHGDPSVIDAIAKIGNEDKACERAKLLHSTHSLKETSPIDANPSTTVHILVKTLRDLIDWYGYNLQ